MKTNLQALATTFVVLSLIFILFTTQFPVGMARENTSITESSRSISPANTSERSLDELDVLLEQDPDVQALLAISDEMTQRVIDRNVSISALKAAYQAKDEQQVIALLGYSDAEIKDLSYRLENRRKAIFDKYPEIVRMVKEKPEGSCGYCNDSSSCTTDRFFDRFSVFEQNRPNRPTCRWSPYVAALAVCTLAGPAWYWPCAYVALCSFCTGGWVSTACFE